MAQGRKYTNLPDLDTSPDIFESHETATNKVQDDSATPTSDSPSTSDAESAISDLDSPPAKTSRITRHTLSTADARSHFKDSRVDARGVDFSDRITHGRRSYRVPKCRRRRIKRSESGYIDEYEFESEEEESFEEKVARLRREVAEVTAEGETRAKGGGKDAESVEEIGILLASLQAQTRTVQPPRPSPSSTAPATITTQPSQKFELQPTDLAPLIAKTTAFESRLTALEASLGLSSLVLVDPSNTPPLPKNILTTLSNLESQIITLSSTTLPSLDSMAAHIQKLKADAQHLSDLQDQAREAREAATVLSPQSLSRIPLPAQGMDSDTTSKINALHISLSSITQLSPLLPAVLDRLKSLRVLHADAATVSERFAEAEKLQARIETEILRWKAAVEGLEGRSRMVEGVEKGNRGVVEGWVGGLEKRVDGLEG